MTLLTMLKGIPLAYNKDLQEDKEAVFDAIDTAKQCLKVLTPMFSTMEILKDNMKKSGIKGLYQCHRLCRLSHEKGDALPGGLPDRGPTGQPVHQSR